MLSKTERSQRGAVSVEWIETNLLIPYATNPRTHTDDQVRKIAASIKEFGFNNPVLLDDSLGIIAGHGRVLAAGILGLEKIPTIQLPHLSDAQRRAYVIADNRLAEEAGWDWQLLKAELERLGEDDFDVNLVGFTDLELRNIMGAAQANDSFERHADGRHDESEMWPVFTCRMPPHAKDRLDQLLDAAGDTQPMWERLMGLVDEAV